MPPEILTAWFIPKESKDLPRADRVKRAYPCDLRRPVPERFEVPQGNGEKPRVYVRRFALIQGGKDGYVIGVYYIEAT